MQEAQPLPRPRRTRPPPGVACSPVAASECSSEMRSRGDGVYCGSVLRFCGAFAVMMVTGQCSNGNMANAAAAIVASSGTACKNRHPWATAGHGAASSAAPPRCGLQAGHAHTYAHFVAKCGLLSRRDGICLTTPSPQEITRKNYPSPSRKFSGKRAETSGPSSFRSCAFQSLPRSSMNRPATRLGKINVATAQMP